MKNCLLLSIYGGGDYRLTVGLLGLTPGNYKVTYKHVQTTDTHGIKNAKTYSIKSWVPMAGVGMRMGAGRSLGGLSGSNKVCARVLNGLLKVSHCATRGWRVGCDRSVTWSIVRRGPMVQGGPAWVGGVGGRGSFTSDHVTTPGVAEKGRGLARRGGGVLLHIHKFILRHGAAEKRRAAHRKSGQVIFQNRLGAKVVRSRPELFALWFA